MKLILFFKLVAVICLTFTGFAHAQIPSGLTKYKLKEVNDLQNVMAQAKDLGVTDAEMVMLVKTVIAAVGTGVDALILDNQHPKYILNFGGASVSFESGKEFGVECMKRSGKAIYTVDGNKFKGKETLDNGKTVDAEVVFEGNDVIVTRKSQNVNLEIKLTRI